MQGKYSTTTFLVDDIFSYKWEKNNSNTSNSASRVEPQRKRSKFLKPIVEWVKCANYRQNQYYKFARVGDTFVNQGDNVLLPPESDETLPNIAYVCYMFETTDKTKMFHAHIYCRSSDTILDEKSDPHELYVVENCEDMPLDSIIGKVKVDRKIYDRNWHKNGGLNRPGLDNKEKAQNNFFYSKRYICLESRIVDFIDDPKALCMSCLWNKKETQFETATVHFYAEELGSSFITWHNEKFFEGSGVLIDYERETVTTKKRSACDQEPDANISIDETTNASTVNSEKYPEKYRSLNKMVDIEYPCQPLTVGVIEKIQKNGITKIREFYRVEDTGKEYGHPHLVYWTNKIYTIDSMKKWQEVVKGKCYVSNKANIDNVENWIDQGPFRFYYESCYNPDTKKFSNLSFQQDPDQKTRKSKNPSYVMEEAPLYKEIGTKLKSFDIYAGCGGLSEGLERAGLVDTKWAIEKNPTTAEAFKKNHPTASVFTDDCNFLLYELLNDRGPRYMLPQKGEVDILVGGPPCQGFSVINRFQASAAAVSNNNQIKTYLGFVDYYRPKYFLFENVRNFASHEQSKSFQLTLRCLLEIGYQMTFGVLNAGKYGLPQARRRLFILGAAPGLELPVLPEPTHCFGSFKEEVDTIKVNGLIYDLGRPNWGKFGSLPFRRVTIKDAIEDLPVVTFDSMSDEMPYTNNEESLSHYARLLRKYANRADIVTYHRCNKPSAITRKRMELIPNGGDWTDLPNIAITLDDGTTTEVLCYSFSTERQKKSDPPRGICGDCVNKKVNKEKCTKKCQEKNSIIPWSVAHTADRNNHWRGVYGRHVWDGHFGTITTNIDPTASSGRVLHPDQHRTLTVRECARGQGYHDEYIFTGSLQDMYEQVGNSVPPILATAIGRAIMKSL